MTEEEIEPDIGRKNWVAIGIALGAGIGVVTDNIGLWVAIGLAIGVAMNNRKEDAKNKESEE
jgi:hypothetical protein